MAADIVGVIPPPFSSTRLPAKPLAQITAVPLVRRRTGDAEVAHSPNGAEGVCGRRGDALFFSRAPFPGPRGGAAPPAGGRRHIGVYAYRRDFLLRFAELEPGVLEALEKLEQLRALERGFRIRVVASVAPSLEVDTAEDLTRARTHARRLGG